MIASYSVMTYFQIFFGIKISVLKLGELTLATEILSTLDLENQNVLEECLEINIFNKFSIDSNTS